MDQFLEDQALPKYLHSMLKLLLFTFAIFPSDYKLIRSVYYWILIITVGGGLLGNFIPLYLTNESVLKIEIFSTLIPQLADLLIFIYFSHKRNQLLQVIRSLASKNSNDVLERTSRFLKANFVTYFILHTAWASLFIVHTFVYLLSDQQFSHKYSIMIPFWLSCEIADGNHLCWRPDTTLELWLANIFTGMAVGLDYWVYSAALLLYSVFMTNVWIHLETLKSSIRAMAELMKSQCRRTLVTLGKSDEYDNAVIEEMYRNIRYQQLIRSPPNPIEYLMALSTNRYCNEIIDFMRGYVSIFLAEFWGTVVFLAFTSIMEVKTDRMFLIKSSIISVSGAIGFVIHCIYAQVITDSNEMILRELADIPWYEQSLKFRQIYLMCLTHNQKSINVTAAGMFTFNYGFSMNCLKTMYSFLNMMILHYKQIEYLGAEG